MLRQGEGKDKKSRVKKIIKTAKNQEEEEKELFAKNKIGV